MPVTAKTSIPDKTGGMGVLACFTSSQKCKIMSKLHNGNSMQDTELFIYLTFDNCFVNGSCESVWTQIQYRWVSMDLVNKSDSRLSTAINSRGCRI